MSRPLHRHEGRHAEGREDEQDQSDEIIATLSDGLAHNVSAVRAIMSPMACKSAGGHRDKRRKLSLHLRDEGNFLHAFFPT